MAKQNVQEKRKAKFAWKAHTIFDDLGRRLDERTVEFGEVPKDFSRFVGFGEATVRHPQVQNPIHGEFRFPIIADDVSEALDKYDAAMAEKLPEAREAIMAQVDGQIKQQQMQQSILPASHVPPMPPGSILGPGGQPLNGPNGRLP